MINLIQLCWSGYYYSKNRGCYGNGNLVAGNIKKGISIFGVTGTYYVDPVKWVVQNGALCSGIGLEWVWRYIPNDEGTDRWIHEASVSPKIDNWQGNAYIRTSYTPFGYDRSNNTYYFTNVGGRLFNYTGSSASNWKIPSFHVDWVAKGLGGSDLGIYYAFGGSNGGFLKRVTDAIPTWNTTDAGSTSITSVSSTVSGELKQMTYWNCEELQSGSILIGLFPAGSSYTTQFGIRNLWFDTRSYI